MGGWRWRKQDPISLQQILRKFSSLLGCLLTVPPNQTLREHPPGELAMESKASKGVINST